MELSREGAGAGAGAGEAASATPPPWELCSERFFVGNQLKGSVLQWKHEKTEKERVFVVWARNVQASR